MKNQDEKWKPEVGQECEYYYLRGGTECSGECIIEARSNDKVWFKPKNSQDVVRREADTQFYPTQTQADKLRDEQVQRIFRLLPDPRRYREIDTANALFDEGARILKPGQKICTPLSNEEIADLAVDVTPDDLGAFANAIQRKLGLIEEK